MEASVTSPLGARLPGALKDAAIAAFVSLALFAFIVGVRTVDAPGELLLGPRPWLLTGMAAAVFVGRLLLNLFVFGRRRAPAALERVIAPVADWIYDWSQWLVLAGIAFAAALPFLPFTDRYILDVSIMVLTYIMLGWGLNVVVGLAGLLDLGYVAFYAVGAYSYALIAIHFGLSFWVTLPLAGLLATLWGVILGFPVLRLRGDYLAIVTLAFGEIIRIVLINWYSLTNGPDGISRIPRPTLFGLEFTRNGEPSFHDFFGLQYSPMQRITFLFYIILALALLTNFVTTRLRRLPLGRAWEALREDEIACRALGINTRNTKLTAFAIGAMFGGFAGSFFATRQGFISPESFTFIESAIILAIVVLGGLGSQVGVVIAAVVMIGGFEAFRELEEFRMLMFGLLMVVIMVWRPRGLITAREPSVYLREKKVVSGDLVQEGRG